MAIPLIPILLFSFIPLVGLSQKKLVPCTNSIQTINKDSIHKTETTFQKYNLFFLTGTCSDSSYVKSNVYNKAAFNSTILGPCCPGHFRKTTIPLYSDIQHCKK